MPSRLQWWRDHLSRHHVLPVVVAGALLLAAAVWWFRVADTMVFYLGTGVIRLAPVF
jgi:hypothetical protein